jgi:alanyl-tRNA synthetase
MGSMDPKLAKELDLRYFREQGFQRHTCTSCHETFWTLDPKVTLCGDPPCVEYDFIGHPLTARPYTLAEMREEFQRFFESKDHTRVKRYPVVARWREDIYLTIASIADFQPFVTSGEVPPPANPLVISQPCIRLNDLANVGKTGRHFTLFEMMAHHAFNSPGNFKYFADECVQYADEFLTKVLKIDRSRITYKEQIWSGGGNAGPAVEVLAGGLEVATLVFMNMVEAKDGEYEVKGERYDKMPMQIVDTGWGLERLTWASQGSPNAYQCVFPKVETFIMDRAGITERLKDARVHRIMQEHARVSGVMSLDLASKLLELRSEVAKRLKKHGVDTTPAELQQLMAPIEDSYAVADHTRCLAFMLGDGIVPSNAKAGYLARLIVRRTLRLMESLGLKMPIRELVALQVEELRKDFPELHENLPRVVQILDLETERYNESLGKGLRLVQRSVKKGEAVSIDKLVDFYDSHGLPPDVVKRVAEPMGAKVDIPDAFDAIVATPVSIEDVITGEILWGATRALISTTYILVILSAWGVVDSPMAIAVLPIAILPGVMFASISHSYTSVAWSVSSLNYFFAVFITPMFWLAGVFFPIERLPEWAQKAAWWLPATHVVEVYRGLTSGDLEWSYLGDVAWIVVAGAMFYALALFSMRRRLIK